VEQARFLSHGQTERFYDRFGAKLDTQSFYEMPALRDLAKHLDLKTCRALVEFGCGTGRFAAELLETSLSSQSTYLGVDISRVMVALTNSRLARYGRRAEVRKSDGTSHIDSPDGAFDRFICSYVLDLLPDDEIRTVLREAHRVLMPGGLLGLVSLTNGPTLTSRFVSTLWSKLDRISPWLVGGCRPVEIIRFVASSEWKIDHRKVVTPFGVPSEIVVARRLATPRSSSGRSLGVG
jgi:ubiquinone/menaquinone biosynthesis C-methylase UbiE